jgi:hypothetical protein
MAQALELVGVFEQGERAIADQVDRRLVASDEQQEHHREQLVGTEVVAGFFSLDQGGGQVIAGLSAAQHEEAAEIAHELQRRRQGNQEVAARGDADHLAGPVVKAVAVRRGHAEEVGDDGGRNGQRVIADQIEFVAT